MEAFSATGGVGSRGARFFGYVADGLGAVGTLLIIVVMGVMDTDIAGRFLLNRPLSGVPEIVVMSIAAIVYLQLPSALRAGRLIQSDALIVSLQQRAPRALAALQAAYCLLGAAAFATLFWAVLPLVVRSFELNDFYGNPGQFTFPKWPVGICVLIGCGLTAVQFLVFSWSAAAAAIGRKPA